MGAVRASMLSIDVVLVMCQHLRWRKVVVVAALLLYENYFHEKKSMHLKL